MKRRRDQDHDEGRHLRQQVAEDTCTKHGVFCCPLCFDTCPLCTALRELGIAEACEEHSH